MREAQRRHEDPIAAVLDEVKGKQLFRGNVVDVARRATEGFLRGRCIIEGLDEDRGATLEIAFQNEWVVAWRARDQNREPVAMSPDLICALDTASAMPSAPRRSTWHAGDGRRAAGAAGALTPKGSNMSARAPSATTSISAPCSPPTALGQVILDHRAVEFVDDAASLSAH